MLQLYLHVRWQNVRNQVVAEVHLRANKNHLFRRVLVQPPANHRPHGREYGRRVQDQAHAQSLREVLAQEPYEILNQLVVHAGRAELGQVEDDAQIVRHLLEAFVTGGLLEAWSNERGRHMFIHLFILTRPRNARPNTMNINFLPPCLDST